MNGRHWKLSRVDSRAQLHSLALMNLVMFFSAEQVQTGRGRGVGLKMISRKENGQSKVSGQVIKMKNLDWRGYIQTFSGPGVQGWSRATPRVLVGVETPGRSGQAVRR